MHYLKFSLFFLVVFSVYANDCLMADFSITVNHKTAPLGLFKATLKVDKKGCEVQVYSKRYFVLTRKWLIDVCREPIHIKEGVSSFSVYKKSGEKCNLNVGKQSDYCESYHDLLEILEDDGLIFANGEKEILESDHGKIFCSYELVRDYLNDGEVFSRYGESNFKKVQELEQNSTELNNLIPTENVKIEETKDLKNN